MMKKELRTPYKPMLDSSDDTKHFDSDMCNIPVESPDHSLTNQSPPLLYTQQKQNSTTNEDNPLEDDFDGFTFEAQTVLSPKKDLQSDYLKYNNPLDFHHFQKDDDQSGDDEDHQGGGRSPNNYMY